MTYNVFGGTLNLAQLFLLTIYMAYNHVDTAFFGYVKDRLASRPKFWHQSRFPLGLGSFDNINFKFVFLRARDVKLVFFP